MKYYVNRDTGKLLDKYQMEKEWVLLYDGYDDTHGKCKSEQYEEVVSVECQEQV